MKKFYNENPSIKKLEEDIEKSKYLFKIFQIFGIDENLKEDEILELNDSIKKNIEIIVTFRNVFHKRGWILSANINFKMIEEVVKNYKEKDIEEAEKILLDYYTNKDNIEKIYTMIKLKYLKYIKEWLYLIEKAFEYHIKKEYVASVPLFLIIIDGTVSHFTKQDNFFSTKIDLSVEDSLSQQISEIKDIFFKARKKTNTEPIYIPYRNGILHGRDVNYDNKYVSSKLTNLLIAVLDWMYEKETEDERIKKNNELKDFSSKSFLTYLEEERETLQKRKKIDEFLNQWKPNNIIFTKDIPDIDKDIFPERGSIEEYQKYPYLEILVKILNFWKVKNYGCLAKFIKNKAIFKKDIKDKTNSPGELKKTFGNYKLNEFRLLKMEDKAPALKKIYVELDFDISEEIKHLVKYNKKEVEFLVVINNDIKSEDIEEYLKVDNWHVDSSFFDRMVYTD